MPSRAQVDGCCGRPSTPRRCRAWWRWPRPTRACSTRGPSACARSTWPGDDARHRLPHRLDDQGDHLGRGDAARRAGQAQARGARAQHRPGAELAPGAGGLRRRGRAQAASGQAADHAAPPADPHGRVQLRHVGRRTGRYIKAAGLPARSTGKLASIRTPLVVRSRRRGSTASTPTGSGGSSRWSAARRSTPTSATRSSRRSA